MVLTKEKHPGERVRDVGIWFCWPPLSAHHELVGFLQARDLDLRDQVGWPRFDQFEKGDGMKPRELMEDLTTNLPVFASREFLLLLGQRRPETDRVTGELEDAPCGRAKVFGWGVGRVGEGTDQGAVDDLPEGVVEVGERDGGDDVSAGVFKRQRLRQTAWIPETDFDPRATDPVGKDLAFLALLPEFVVEGQIEP